MCSKSLNRPLRLRAAELFEQGHGYKAVSTELGVNRETIREWSYTWRALGTEGLLASDRNHYPSELKLAVVRDRQAGLSVVDVMEKYQINNRNRIKEWCRVYKKYGEEAFR